MRLTKHGLFAPVAMAEALLMHDQIPLCVDLAHPRGHDCLLDLGAALGALGPRIEPSLFERLLLIVMEHARGCSLPASIGAVSWAGVCAQSIAGGLREAIGDHAEGLTMAEDQWAYWTDEPSERKRWDKISSRLGLVYNEDRARQAAKAIWKAGAEEMEGLFGRLGPSYPGGEERWMSDRASYMTPIAECLAREPGMDDGMLVDLSRWAQGARMPTADHWWFVSQWPKAEEGSAKFDFTGAVIAECASMVQPGRTSFPWAAWVALTLPEKLPTWGKVLGEADARADVELLMALGCHKTGDNEVWLHGEKEACEAAAVLLDQHASVWELKVALGEVCAPGFKATTPRI